MWLLSQDADNIENAFLVYKSGYLNGRNEVNNSLLIRPTLYLKSNVYVTDGDGTSSNPYKLETDEKIEEDNQAVVISGQAIDSDKNNEIDNNSEDKTIVNVPSTLSTLSNILLIISGLLIVFGIGLYGYNYYKLKNGNK